MGMEMDTSSRSVQDSLKLVQGPLLTNEEYIRAVEAAVVAVGRGAGAGRDARDWSTALKRLLMVRRSPPLALWWAFSCVECGAVLGFKGGLEEASGLVSSVSGLVQSLKSFSIGNADHDTAIAVLAPVLSAVYEVTQLMSRSVGMLGQKGLSEGEEGVGKKRRKIAKRLRELIREVLTFLVLCRKWEFDAFDALPGPPAAPDFERKFGSLLAAENVKGVSPHPSAFITFPVSSRASKVLGAGENLSSRELADVLCAEVVLLHLLVEIIDWRSRLKKQKKNFEPGSHELVGKLKHIAVHAAATAGSSGSSEALVEMLLDARLPVGDVLDTQEELVLRGVLYEAIFVKPPVHDVPPQDLSSFMKKVAAGRLAMTLFRSKNEHSRGAAIQEKLMCIAPPPHFLEWLKTTENGQKPFLGAVHETKALGWLVESVDDSTFNMLLDKCERSELHPEIDEMAIATEAGGEEDMYFIDKKGNMGADMDEDQLVSDVADRAFASAARHISESNDLVAADSPDEHHGNGKLLPVDESEPEKSGSGADFDFEMEGDDGRHHGNGSGSKRPRDAAFAQAILLLSSSEESEDDVIEVSERDAKRVKQDSNGQYSGRKSPHSTEPTPSVVEVKGQGKEPKEDGLARNDADEEMLEGQFNEVVHTDEVLRETASSLEVAESKCLQVEDGQDTGNGLRTGKPICTPNQSGQISEDKPETFLDRLDSHGDEKRFVEPLGSQDLHQSDQGTPASESGGKQKAKRVKSLKQNGNAEGVVTPKRRYATRAKQEDEECVKHLPTPERLEVKEQTTTRPQTPEPCKVFETCVTPSNAGSKMRKRQAETTPDVYQPRVTRSGKVLGVTHSVEKSTKKTRKGKPVALQPIFDSNGE